MALPADSPARYPIDVYQGGTFALAVNVTANAVPYDLTGYVGSAEVRNRPGGRLVATFDVSHDGVGGTVLAVLPPEQSVLVVRDGWWDLKLTRTDGFVRPVLAGAVRATERVTE